MIELYIYLISPIGQYNIYTIIIAYVALLSTNPNPMVINPNPTNQIRALKGTWYCSMFAHYMQTMLPTKVTKGLRWLLKCYPCILRQLLYKHTLLHELACNIASYCMSGCGIFTSRRRVKMQPTSEIIAMCMLTV